MRRFHTTLMASCALAAMAANTDQGSASEPDAPLTGTADVSAPEGGQIALTARNNQDGTWAITRGPGGDVLETGLQRDEALAIVGAPSRPIDPDNEEEVELVERRRQVEARAAEITNAKAFEPDAPEAPRAHQIGGPDPVISASADNPENGRAGNGDLASENAALREENEALKAQVAKFDPDGDGKVGGAVVRAEGDDGLTKAEIIADLEGMQVEFDPRAKKDELLALRNEHRAQRDAQANEG